MGNGEMAHQLRAHAVFPVDLVYFLAHILDRLQLLITPAPVFFVDTCMQMAYIHTDIST